MKNWKKELIGLVALIAALALFMTAATALLRPVRNDYGSTWRAFSQQAPDCFDIMFYGSSMVYCDLVPAELWDATGMTSYVMGGSEQTIPITYRYVRQSLQKQSPQAIFVEVTGAFYHRYMSYTAINLDYMPRGINWLGAVAAAAEPEQRAQRLFPISAYHSRWVELPLSQLTELLPSNEPDLWAGYTFVSGIGEIGTVSTRTDLKLDEKLYAENLSWLNQIQTLCRNRGIICVFYLAPSYSRLPDEWTAMLKADLESDGACFMDLNESMDEMGIDVQTDFFDYLHFNCYGAAKFSAYMGEVAAQLGVTASDPEHEDPVWQQRLTHFRAQCEAAQQN